MPKPHQLQLLFLLLATVVVYFNSLFFDFLYNYDDDLLLLNNPQIQQMNWSSLKTMFTESVFGLFHPFTTLSFAIEKHLFNFNPAVFRFTNLILHLANAMLVYKLLLLWLKKQDIALFCVAIFLLHPSRVESVAWISERKDLLYLFFYLLSLIGFHYFQVLEKKRQYLLSFGFFCAALLSKATAVSLPVLMLLLQFFIYRKKHFKSYLPLLPFFGMSLLFGIINLKVQSDSGFIRPFDGDTSLLYQLLLPLQAFASYFYVFINPLAIGPKHFYPESIAWSITTTAVILIGAAIYYFYKKPFSQAILLGSVLFLGSIWINIKWIPVGNDLFSDRYLYFPIIGLAVIVSGIFQELTKKKIPFLLISSLGILLAAMSFSSTKHWENTERLWQKVLKDYPNHPIPLNELGRYYLDGEDLEKASNFLRKAENQNRPFADLYNNIGRLYFAKQDFKNAEDAYKKALSLNDKLPEAAINLAVNYNAMGLAENSLEVLNNNSSLLIYPQYYEAAGIAHAILNNTVSAEALFKSGIQKFPSNENLLTNYALFSFRNGEKAAAFEALNFLFSEKKNKKAGLLLAQLLIEDKELNNAENLLKKMEIVMPNDGEVHLQYGNFYASKGLQKAACDKWQRAAQLGNPQAKAFILKFCNIGP